jgi:hypothetical protein
MVHRIRRVVTGHDRNGKSVFVEDRKAPNVLEMASMPGVALTDLWRTMAAPASNAGNKDAAAGKIKLEPPASGTILRIVEFPPDQAWRKTADAEKAFASIGAGGAPDHASGEKRLRAGDVLIQRGTNHSWSVRTKQPCVIAAVLIGANPVGRLARKKKR